MSDAYRVGLVGACPRCDSPLGRLDHGGIALDECGACGGAFVAQAALEQLAESSELRLRVRAELVSRPRYVEQAVRYLRCPKCRRAMNRKVFGRVSGVVVDVCKDDGVFFDAGEIAATLSFIDDGGLARQAAIEAREKAERQKEARRPSTIPALPASMNPVVDGTPLIELLVELFR